MRGRFATFALIAAVICAGCTSTPGHPDGPNSTAAANPAPVPTPSTAPAVSDPAGTSSAPTSPPPVVGTEVPADVPTTGPNLRHKDERPPVMPLLATKHTPAGAVAFAKFFELTTDWAYATTSTTYMRHYYQHSCVTCRSIASAVDKAAAEHHHFVGGRMTITGATDEGPNGTYRGQHSVLVSYKLTSAEVVDRAGDFVDGEPALEMKDQLHLAWTDAWIVTEVSPKP